MLNTTGSPITQPDPTAEGLASASASTTALPLPFTQQLQAARRRAITVGLVSALVGLASLLAMVYMAASGRDGGLNILKMAFLGGGAVSVGIGLGLASCSGGARSAGSVWFVAWGVLNLLAGFAGALSKDVVLGVFALVAGTAHCLFAALIASADIVFVCDYLGGDLAENHIREAIPAAAASDSIEILDLISPALRPQPPEQ